MNCEYVTVYNQDGEMLGVLENAGEVAYNLVHNDLWTASFTLPSGDPKNSLCQAHNLVHLPDSARDTGLYRIIGMPSGEETAAGGVKTYNLEHVMATLLDDVLFGYHEIGGPGVTTAQVIQYILDQQHTERWVLGECEYSDQFAYKFENTSLLSALLSLGNVLTDEYTWVFDTSASPWAVSLKHADATPGCGIHYRRNMVEVEKEMDASTLVTRLYMLGYGEGVNQLTIRDINGGVPYIDADTKNVWGVKSSVYADTRIEDAATLKARGVALLNRLKNPYISYTASAVDLTRLTGQEWDKHMPGKLVRVLDGEHGIDFDARIVHIAKSDVRGRPGEIDITIANATRDAADSINTLADRMGISELYSQGATNLYSQQYADNADAQHPAKMRVYVPSGCVRINQMLLSWQMEAFRAYETGAAAGGATATTTSSGGASTNTSSAGGSSSTTSSAGGAQQVTSEQKSMTMEAATGEVITTTGYPSGCTGGAVGTSGSGVASTTSAAGGGNTSEVQVVVNSVGGHTHTGPSHTHGMGHFHHGPAHSHGIAGHTHSGPSRRHSFSGSDSVANGHYHRISDPGSSTITGGVSSNSTHSISISGNTMNIINIMARNGRTQDILAVNNALIRMLRDRLNVNTSPYATVRGEVQMLRQYVLIVEYKYGAHIDITYEFNHLVEDAPIPKGILQLLVENALVHGLMGAEDDALHGSISVAIYPEADERLVIEVNDDGRGIDAERLEYMRAHKFDISTAKEDSHIGLNNIYKRLEYLYPGNFQMDIFSHKGDGTSVVISIPYAR